MSRFRHYVNLSRTAPRLERLLRDFAWDRMDRVYAETLASSPLVVRCQRFLPKRWLNWPTKSKATRSLAATSWEPICLLTYSKDYPARNPVARRLSTARSDLEHRHHGPSSGIEPFGNHRPPAGAEAADDPDRGRVARCGRVEFVRPGASAVSVLPIVGYGRVVACYGYKPRYLAFLRNRDLVGALPVAEVSSVLYRRRLVSQPFSDTAVSCSAPTCRRTTRKRRLACCATICARRAGRPR